MAHMTLGQILCWTQGTLYVPPEADTLPTDFVFNDLSSDTRAIMPGDVFLALRGSRFDGHDFLQLAADQKAKAVIVDQASFQAGIKLILPAIVVSDTLIALQQIARGYRLTLPGKVIGITGSVGKTTTRGLIAACLQTQLKICQTEANNNNEIGLPKTLLTATPNDQAIILEMGMRGRGEIELLSQIAVPDIALITNIGYSHIERLGSQEEILRAKAEILTGLKPGGLLILNADDEHLLALAYELRSATDILPNVRLAFVTLHASFKSPWDDVPVYLGDHLQINGDHSRFVLTIEQDALKWPIELPMPGKHLVLNTLFGLACAAELHLNLAQAALGAQHFAPTGNRQRMMQAGPVLIMDDSYNASPESMQAALETLRLAAHKRRLIAALGGMLELGDYAPAAHFQVGAFAAEAGYAIVLAIGPHAKDLQAGFDSKKQDSSQQVEIFDDQKALIERLLDGLRPRDALLVKGSRGFSMERVTVAVHEHFASAKETLI